MPSGSEEASNTRSAGTKSPFRSTTMSPTHTSCQRMRSLNLEPARKTSTSRAFTSRSCLCRFYIVQEKDGRGEVRQEQGEERNLKWSGKKKRKKRKKNKKKQKKSERTSKERKSGRTKEEREKERQCAYDILVCLLERCECEHNTERDERGSAARRRNIRDLLYEAKGKKNEERVWSSCGTCGHTQQSL